MFLRTNEMIESTKGIVNLSEPCDNQSPIMRTQPEAP